MRATAPAPDEPSLLRHAAMDGNDYGPGYGPNYCLGGPSPDPLPPEPTPAAQTGTPRRHRRPAERREHALAEPARDFVGGIPERLETALDVREGLEDVELAHDLLSGTAPSGGLDPLGLATSSYDAYDAMDRIQNEGANGENVMDLNQAGLGLCAATPTPAQPVCAALGTGMNIGERADEAVEDATGQSTSDRLSETAQRLTFGRAPTATRRGLDPADEANPCAYAEGTPERQGVPARVCDREAPRVRDVLPVVGMVEDAYHRIAD